MLVLLFILNVTFGNFIFCECEQSTWIDLCYAKDEKFLLSAMCKYYVLFVYGWRTAWKYNHDTWSCHSDICDISGVNFPSCYRCGNSPTFSRRMPVLWYMLYMYVVSSISVLIFPWSSFIGIINGFETISVKLKLHTAHWWLRDFWCSLRGTVLH